MSNMNSQSSTTSENSKPELTSTSTSPTAPLEPSQPSSSRTNENLDTNTNQNSDQEQSSSSSSTSPAPTPKKCDNCSAPQSEVKPLKPCSKCQSVSYCDRECQKKHFKVHKKVCAAAAQEYAMNANLKVESSRRPPRDSHRGGLQKWQFDT